MLVLEPYDAARARGARAMRLADEDAQLPREAIGYVNAHGTGTMANDATETQAIRAVFEGHADALAVSSTKAMHGHALEAAATLLALHHGLLPPTVNYDEPDPQCALDVVPNRPRLASVQCALSNSFAFGGMNAVVAFGAPR